MHESARVVADEAVTEPGVTPFSSQNHDATTIILIVDDEPVNRQVLVNYLPHQEYSILQAASGHEALEIMSNLPAEQRPELLLLDVMMPHMTGYEVTEKLRQTWPAVELPILLLTAKNQVGDLVQGLHVGANDYITKPVLRDELLARLKTHLNILNLKAENAQMGAEIEISHRLQQMVLPSEQELLAIQCFDIAAFMDPADIVGGDYYDILQNNERIVCSIGDVTGHGLESGVIMLMVQAAMRTLFESGMTDLKHFLNIVNSTIYHNLNRMNVEKNLTLTMFMYQNGKLLLCGQHEEVLLVRAGMIERIDTIDLGFMVGLEEDISCFLTTLETQLGPDDGVVLYTDGITEANNQDASCYGVDRLCNMISDNWQYSAHAIQQAIIADLKKHVGSTSNMADDVTLVVLKHKPTNSCEHV